jgi:CheY-like chemotaxis protein
MPKVLLAEDDQTMISLLKTLLKMEGFEVVALNVDADVPTMVQHEKPDVLFMDVHLGDQNGLEIADAIRNNPEIRDVKIVMTSGMNLKDECLRSGADHFLLKPFMPDDLINVLKEQNEPS